MSPNLIPTTLQNLLTGAAFAPIQNTGWLRVTGEDRTRWLNGMTTNSIQALEPGQGCYTFFLSAQGRIQADAYAFARTDSILLETGSAGSLAIMLDRFIIMDDVELEVVGQDGGGPAGRAGLQLLGPESPRLLSQLGLTPAADLTLLTERWQGESVDLVHTHSPLVPRFELWSDPATIGLFAETLRHIGALEATPELIEQLRIHSGTPLYGIDIRDRDLPQETAQTRALHFSKGCYLGQEIVERIHSRGNVHRTFAGFTLAGDVPPSGAVLSSGEKPVGELTSVARIGSKIVALGTLRREALDTHAPLTYPGGTAVATPLPFPAETCISTS